MARLSIKTNLKSIVVVGAFCDWDLDSALRIDLKHDRKLIHIDNFPEGEYRVLSCRSWQGGEIYPSDGRQMGNRYFNGKEDEKIYCYF